MSNENITYVVNLLNKKRELLLELERCSSACLADNSIPQAIEKRADIISAVDDIDKQIIEQLDMFGAQKNIISKAIKNSCNRGDFSEDVLPIFDAAQQNFSVLNRIKALSEEMMKLLESRHKEIKGNLKLNNQKPKIAKYFPSEKIEMYRNRG